MNPSASSFVSINQQDKWIVGYREKKGPFYNYYVQYYDLNITSHNIISFADDLIANKDNNYIVKLSHYEIPKKSKSNVWLIIDFHENLFECTFKGNYYNVCKQFYKHMDSIKYKKSYKSRLLKKVL